VVALARAGMALGWKVGQLTDPEAPGWPVLYVDTPHGQVSWHFPEPEMPEDIPAYEGEWDGHGTEEKYARLARLA
jgi:hypothetical protein